MTTAVLLIDPKYPHNVGGALRSCSIFGAPVLMFTGSRVSMVGGKGPNRIPREERMRAYRNTELRHVNEQVVFDKIRGVPVAVEIMPDAEPLPLYRHPEDAVYVFGREDGSLGRGVLGRCQEFVRIPSASCLNLAAAVNVVLYDRMVKSHVDEPEWFYQEDQWRGPSADDLDVDRRIESLLGLQ